MIIRPPRKASDIPSSEIFDSEYDFVLSALGYEARSSHVGTMLKGRVGRRIAVAFADGREFSFSENEKKLKLAGFEIVEESSRKVGSVVSELLNELAQQSDGIIRGCIDISSVTRLRMGSILEALSTFSKPDISLDISFVYNVAEYRAPASELELATICGPVSSFFAGWPDDPERPVAAILGLGYEMEKALGALEYIEPATSLLVCPISKDQRYDDNVVEANTSLTSRDKLSEVYRYHVDRGTDCIELIDALVSRLEDDYRIVILPFGPKLFALCAMLIAIRDYPKIGVWRVSSNEPALRRDQQPSGTTVGLRVIF